MATEVLMMMDTGRCIGVSVENGELGVIVSAGGYDIFTIHRDGSVFVHASVGEDSGLQVTKKHGHLKLVKE